MHQVVLGRTGLKVSRIALGGLFVASFVTDLENAKKAVQRALELGINYIDTAPGYGNSEEVLGKALAGVEKPLVISTKLGGRPAPFKPQDKDCLLQSVEMSLKLLGRDHIDILIIHEPDRPRQYDWWTSFADVTGPVLDVLDGLKQQGVIKYTGLGGTGTTDLAYLCRSGKFDVLLTAYNYSILWREAALEVIPAAKEKKMGVIAGSPLQQGALAKCYPETIGDPRVWWLSKPRREQLRRLYQLVQETGMPLPEMGIRFVLSNPDIDCVLMGARNPEEVEQNVAATGKGPLPKDLLGELDEIAAMVPFRPFGEPFGIGWLLGAPGNYKGMAKG